MRVMQIALQAINKKPSKSHFKHPSPINKVQFFHFKRKYAQHTRTVLYPSERGEKRKLYTHRHQKLAFSLSLSLSITTGTVSPTRANGRLVNWEFLFFISQYVHSTKLTHRVLCRPTNQFIELMMCCRRNFSSSNKMTVIMQIH